MLVLLWFIMIGFILLMGFAVIMATFIHWVRKISAPPQPKEIDGAP